MNRSDDIYSSKKDIFTVFKRESHPCCLLDLHIKHRSKGAHEESLLTICWHVYEDLMSRGDSGTVHVHIQMHKLIFPVMASPGTGHMAERDTPIRSP